MIRVKERGSKASIPDTCVSTTMTVLGPDLSPLSEVSPSIHHHVVQEYRYIWQ